MSEKELKDQRIPIMMTNSEVTDIDDWSFQHRIRSRGEAIRRLVQIGLAFDRNRKKLLSTYKVESDAVADLAKIAQLALARGPKELTDLERALVMGVLDALKGSAGMAPVIRTTTGIAENFKGEGDIEAIIEEAKDILSDEYFASDNK